jgi:hypothetical protein
MNYINFPKANSLKYRGIKAMLIVILTILGIASCSDSELKTDSPVSQNEPAFVQNIYLNMKFLGFETADQFIVAQLPKNNEYNLDRFSQFNQVVAGDNKIMLIADTEKISISVSDEDYDLIVDGIMVFTKNTNDSMILSEYIESLNDTQDKNCWSGGEGTKSCSTMYRGPEIYVICRTAYFACCNQDMTGLCIAY